MKNMNSTYHYAKEHKHGLLLFLPLMSRKFSNRRWISICSHYFMQEDTTWWGIEPTYSV